MLNVCVYSIAANVAYIGIFFFLYNGTCVTLGMSMCMSQCNMLCLECAVLNDCYGFWLSGAKRDWQSSTQ